jgi:hypothetical protein
MWVESMGARRQDSPQTHIFFGAFIWSQEKHFWGPELSSPSNLAPTPSHPTCPSSEASLGRLLGCWLLGGPSERARLPKHLTVVLCPHRSPQPQLEGRPLRKISRPLRTQVILTHKCGHSLCAAWARGHEVFDTTQPVSASAVSKVHCWKWLAVAPKNDPTKYGFRWERRKSWQ